LRERGSTARRNRNPKRQARCFIFQPRRVTMPSQIGEITETRAGGIADSKKRQGGRAMQQRSQTVRSFHQSRPVVPCAQCGEALFAPEWSEYLDDHRIRHYWSCESCSYQFEMMVCYPAPDEAAA
jgi:hypothetical protein